jgi:hypothetical protein
VRVARGLLRSAVGISLKFRVRSSFSFIFEFSQHRIPHCPLAYARIFDRRVCRCLALARRRNKPIHPQINNHLTVMV